MGSPPALLEAVRRSVRRWRWLIALAAFLRTFASASALELPPLPVLDWFEPAPVLLEKAAKLDLPTSGLMAGTDAPGVPIGSEVVALIVHEERKRTRQWLVRLVAREPTAQERNLKPVQQRFYTSTGSEIDFAGTWTPIAIQVLGPVTVAPVAQRPAAVKSVWSGAIVPAEHLRLGLDRAGLMTRRLHEFGQRTQRDVGLSWSNAPYDAARIASTQAEVEAFGLSAEDERALVGSTPALMQFFTIAAQTPEVRDVLRELVDLNLWSLVLKGRFPAVGVHLLPSTDDLDLASWGFEGVIARGFPFILELDGRPRLLCSMAVVSPRPPYAASAGVIALAAQPFENDRSRLVLRVIASRMAGETSGAASP